MCIQNDIKFPRLCLYRKSSFAILFNLKLAKMQPELEKKLTETETLYSLGKSTITTEETMNIPGVEESLTFNSH